MKKKKSRIYGKIAIVLAVIVAFFTGGYFFLDKFIVPKYFGSYGINNLSSLVGVMSSLYSSPSESKIVTNGYTEDDLINAISILQESNYNIEDDGTIPTGESFKGDGSIALTDREIASICNLMIENGMLQSALPDLNLDLITMSVLEITITPDEQSFDGEYYTSASLKFIIKVDTENICEQIANQMSTPLYLLEMIIPDTLYFELEYTIDLLAEDNLRTTGTIAINGRTAEQSKVLINLLIDFIFPEEAEMDLEKFTTSIGDVALQGIDALGNFKFAKNVRGTSLSGIYVEGDASES